MLRPIMLSTFFPTLEPCSDPRPRLIPSFSLSLMKTKNIRAQLWFILPYWATCLWHCSDVRCREQTSARNFSLCMQRRSSGLPTDSTRCALLQSQYPGIPCFICFQQLYYQKNSRKTGTCDFQGIAYVVTHTPSKFSIKCCFRDTSLSNVVLLINLMFFYFMVAEYGEISILHALLQLLSWISIGKSLVLTSAESLIW